MKENEIKRMIEEIISGEVINSDKIPDIPLYMDQITTFVEEYLSEYKRNKDDKILTKTMINNYTKFGLITPPVKKKYSKSSIISLILIYHFKNIISINDIKAVTDNIEEDRKQEFYDLFTAMRKNDIQTLSDSLANDAQRIFPQDIDEKDAALLTAMLLINQADIRKQAAERLIDKYFSERDDDKNGKKKPDKEA